MSSSTTGLSRVMVALLLSSALTMGGCAAQDGEPALGDTQLVPGAPVARAGDTFPAAQQPPSTGMITSPTTMDPAAPPPGTGTEAPAPTDTGTPGAPADPTVPAAGAAAPPPAAPADPSGGSEVTDPADPGATAPPADPGTAEPAGAGESAGTLTVTLSSTEAGGRYAPANVGAIWIETGSGQFVKTLERWAGIRAADLRAWNAASGGWGFSFFGLGGGGGVDQMDAITAATLRSHQMHTVSWDMIDNDGQLVPDGSYVLKVEVADGRETVGQVQFEKGPTPVDLSPSGSSWSSLSLSYQP